MVNQSFAQLPREEKRAKLQAALQCMTDNALADTELKAISCAVRLDRQYFIRVHRTVEAFFSDLMHPAQRKTRFIIGGRPVSKRNLEAVLRCAAETGDPITAVVDRANGKSGIYILMPEQRNKEGTTS